MKFNLRRCASRVLCFVLLAAIAGCQGSSGPVAPTHEGTSQADGETVGDRIRSPEVEALRARTHLDRAKRDRLRFPQMQPWNESEAKCMLRNLGGPDDGLCADPRSAQGVPPTAQGLERLKLLPEFKPLFDVAGFARTTGARNINTLDFDRDGVPDILMSGASRVAYVQGWPGGALIYSGRAVQGQHPYLWYREAERATDGYGFSSTVLDFNGDGIDDFAVGAPFANVLQANGQTLEWAGRIYIYDGATGGELARIDGDVDWGWLGWSLANAGRADSDSATEELAGCGIMPWVAWGFPGAGYVQVYKWESGQAKVHNEYFNPYDDEAFGFSLAGAKDFNADGVDDLIIGSPNAPNEEQVTYAGRTYVMNGVPLPDGTGQFLFEDDGSEYGAQFGGKVVSPGQFDGDSVPDILSVSQGAGVSRVTLFRGQKSDDPARFDPKREILHIQGPPYNNLNPYTAWGASVDVIGDYDRDGTTDIAVGEPRAFWHNKNNIMRFGHVNLYSGATGKSLGRFHSADPQSENTSDVQMGFGDSLHGLTRWIPKTTNPWYGKIFVVGASYDGLSSPNSAGDAIVFVAEGPLDVAEDLGVATAPPGGG